MEIIRKNRKLVLLSAFFLPLIGFVVLSAWPSYAAVSNTPSINPNAPWLPQYEGQNVLITFVTVPTHLGTGFQKTSALKLIDVEDSGVVVTFRPNRTAFFPYSQIVSIEPIYH